MAGIENRELLQRKFLELHRAGQLNRDIAKEIGVSQQTLSDWANAMPEIQSERAVRAMQRKLLIIIPTASAQEISQLQDAISKAQKIATSTTRFAGA